MTRVKICGITRERDAAAAVRLGAAAIGIVCWPPSPRFVEVGRARAIVAGLPPLVTAVGVFANQPVEEVRRIAEQIGLGTVQLHGRERPADYGSLRQTLIKAVAVSAETPPDDALALPATVTVLLDAHDPERLGGTGRTIDWRTAAAVARRRRVILSGGLRADNVREAIALVRPYAVDVSSGVEASPGIKDTAKLEAFFGAVRESA